MKLAHGLAVKPSAIHGRGCFATIPFKRRHKIAAYTGEKISNAEARRRAHRKMLRICQVNSRWSLDGSRGGNGTHKSLVRAERLHADFVRSHSLHRLARHRAR